MRILGKPLVKLPIILILFAPYMVAASQRTIKDICKDAAAQKQKEYSEVLTLHRQESVLNSIRRESAKRIIEKLSTIRKAILDKEGQEIFAGVQNGKIDVSVLLNHIAKITSAYSIRPEYQSPRTNSDFVSVATLTTYFENDMYFRRLPNGEFHQLKMRYPFYNGKPVNQMELNEKKLKVQVAETIFVPNTSEKPLATGVYLEVLPKFGRNQDIYRSDCVNFTKQFFVQDQAEAGSNTIAGLCIYKDFKKDRAIIGSLDIKTLILPKLDDLIAPLPEMPELDQWLYEKLGEGCFE